MPKGPLKETLAELKEQLALDGEFDADDRALLLDLRDDIELVLEHTSEVPIEEVQRVQTGVGTAVQRLQRQHPQLTRALNHLAGVLASMGL